MIPMHFKCFFFFRLFLLVMCFHMLTKQEYSSSEGLVVPAVLIEI